MAGRGEDDVVRQTRETIRRTYDQLVETRNLQLKFMAKNRKDENIAFLLTPDLVLQYNYVHQLMKSFRSGTPPDICVEDGGITCSNMKVLNEESFPRSTPADGSDYLASRIVDLLDRPVTVGDEDLTLNVRDDFAANIKTLNLLFEERYRLCQEQSERLRTDLTTTRQQLVASRSAGLEASTRADTDRTVQRMREQITKYEIQLRTVRQQMDELRQLNENTIQQTQRDMEELMQRVKKTGRNEGSDLYLQILHKLFDSLEAERDRVLVTVQQIQLANDKRSHEFSEVMAQLSSLDITGNSTATTAVVDTETQPQYESPANIEAEITARVNKEVSARLVTEKEYLNKDFARQFQSQLDFLNGEFNRKVEIEVANHMATKSVVNLSLEQKIKELTAELEEIRTNFDAKVAEKVAESLKLDTLEVVDESFLDLFNQQQGLSQLQDGGDADLKEYKSTLDDIFKLKDSILEILPMRQQYDLDDIAKNFNGAITKYFYDYIEYLLQKLRDVYKFLTLQSGYIYNIAATAYHQHLSMGKERTQGFMNQVNIIIKEQELEKEKNDENVLVVLKRLLEEMPKIKNALEESYKNQDDVMEKTMKEKNVRIADLEDRISKLYVKLDINEGPLTVRERNEFNQLRLTNRQNMTTIRELQSRIVECTSNNGGSSYYSSRPQLVRASDAKAELSLEVSLHNEERKKFRSLCDEMVTLLIELADDYKSWFHKNKGGKGEDRPRMLREFNNNLQHLVNRADSIINFGASPQPKGVDPFVQKVADEYRKKSGPTSSSKTGSSAAIRKSDVSNPKFTVPASPPWRSSTPTTTTNSLTSPSMTRRRKDRWTEGGDGVGK